MMIASYDNTCNDNLIDFRYKLLTQLYSIQPQEQGARFRARLENIVFVIDYVMENIDADITLNDIESGVGVSKFEICRLFNCIYHTSPMRWIWDIRIELAKEFIKLAPEWSLTDISFACGFTSLSHFSRSFSKVHKVSALKFKNSLVQNAYGKNRDRCFDIIHGREKVRFSRALVLNRLKPAI
ncbi:MAG: AraC family transcriptional regulator [Pantoea sp.]|nr:AraC family transcriptional regulator [Pantoea sp.]